MDIDKEKEETKQELDSQQAKAFRSMAAPCLYLSLGRPGIQSLVKEICRQMSKPTLSAWRKLMRTSRYIRINPGNVWDYKWQDVQTANDVFGDSNWASCSVTKRSRSGGAAKIGPYCTRTCSRTYNLAAEPSAEAELLRVSKSCMRGIGSPDAIEGFGAGACRALSHRRISGQTHRRERRLGEDLPHRRQRLVDPGAGGPQAATTLQHSWFPEPCR